jgi:hypothetical protein
VKRRFQDFANLYATVLDAQESLVIMPPLPSKANFGNSATEEVWFDGSQSLRTSLILDLLKGEERLWKGF